MEKTQRKEREFNMRRAAILAEAEKKFSAKGYHDVSVAEIAKASGFSTGALYQFFQSKEHLYATMISEKMNVLRQVILREVGRANDLDGKLAALVEMQLRIVEKNADFFRIFLREENELSAQMRTALRQQMIDGYFKHLSFVENILKDGIRDGFLRDLPPGDMAMALLHLIRAAAIDWMIISSKETLVSKKDFILDLFFNGVKRHEDS